MPSPPIQLFLTTIASQPALRQRQELLIRVLQVKKIPFKSYDLASDDDAKKLWRRKALPNQQQLPGILVGGKVPGTFAEFEDAVEHDELAIFFRMNENYDPSVEEDRPLLEEKVIGVPGISPHPSPLKPKAAASKPDAGGVSIPQTPATPGASRAPPPTPVNRRNEFDVGNDLVGFGLQGVKVTHDELAALVEELGLEGDEAQDLIKGLGSDSKSESKSEPVPSVAVTSVRDAEPAKAAEPSHTQDVTEKADKKEQPEAVAATGDEKATPEMKGEATIEKVGN